MALLEAVDQLALEREPDPQLYRMLVGALRTLDDAQPAPLVVPAFYWKLLALEGVRPQLDACVRCGEQPDPRRASTWSEGGALCRSCRRGAPLAPDALELMRLVLGGDLVAALAEPASPATHEVERRSSATPRLEHHPRAPPPGGVAVRRLSAWPVHASSARRAPAPPAIRRPEATKLRRRRVALRVMPATDLDQIVNLCQAARLRLPVGRDLRRLPLELRLRPARRR